MHELTLCQRILEIVEKNRLENNGSSVKTVYLEIGQLVAVEKSALALSFTLLAKGTAAEHACLEFIDIAGRALCESCGKEALVRQYYDACSACGSFSLKVIAGEELRVQSMEVE